MGKPGRKSQKQLRDEAWRRLHQADEHGNLPGQLALGEDPAPTEPLPAVDGVPELCPSCGRFMSLEHGWTPNSESGMAIGGYTIQCGFCGKRYHVTEAVWLALKTAIRDRYIRLNPPKPPAQPKRGRGAR